jgi:hypothetical protein
MKKDINYLRHIKPQIKVKEREDKQRSREIKRETAMRVAGLPEPMITLDDIGWIASILKRLRA